MTTLLSATGVTLGYGPSDVVHELDLTVGEGQVVCLIGANGAGKTTVLKGLSGLIRARSGQVSLGGADITWLPAFKIAKLGVAHVPEGRQVFATMTVEQNLDMGGYLCPSASELSRRKADVLARFPRLAERLKQSAGLMSGGEQQMLAVGRALMAAPRLLLLDEPSMGLAPLFVEEIFAIIAGLKQEGRTILLVEQNAQAALEIADYAYVLESGRIKLKGPAAQVAASPEVTAAYLGG